jgi:hypothetical protein
MREALPSILSMRSGRRRNNNCLKRFTARTYLAVSKRMTSILLYQYVCMQ